MSQRQMQADVSPKDERGVGGARTPGGPLTASSCLTNMSDAFSEMFPTKTVVVGPAFSSASFSRTGPDSLF